VIDGSILLRHDLPPEGVRHQVEYVGGAGPRCLLTSHTTHPQLTIYPHSNSPSDAKFAIGKELVICTDGFAAGSPVGVKVVGPDGRTIRADSLAIDLLPGLPLGKYQVIATQSNRKALAAFTLSAATRPGLRVIGEPKRHNSVLVIGAGLASNTMVNVYRQETSPPSEHVPRSVYVSSFPAAPAHDGTSTMRIAMSANMPTGCWWLVVTVHGSSAYDELCV
jgi:hypothetical protein